MKCTVAIALLCINIADTTGKISENESFLFLPSASFWADFASISQNEANFTGLLQKGIEVNIAKFGPYEATFLVHERIFTINRFGETYYPYRIDYVMEYFKFSRSFSFLCIGAFFDHVCYNTINTYQDTDEYQLRWYGWGVQALTHGMKPGKKAIIYSLFRSNFQFLFVPHFSFSTTFPIYTEQFQYRNKTLANVRFDLWQWFRYVLYLEMGIEALVDDEIRCDRSFELGLFRAFDRIAVSCFTRYQYKNDVLLYRGQADGFFYSGFRAETIADLNISPVKIYKSHELLQFRCSGGYGKRIKDEYLGYLTEIGADLDILKYYSCVLLLSLDTYHYSKAQGNALYPRYLSFLYRGAMEYFLSSSVIMGIDYQFARRCDGNEFRGHNENYDQLNVYILSRGMRRGESEYSHTTTTDGFLLHFEYKFQIGYITRSYGWNYDSIFSAAIRWDFYRINIMRLYSAVEGNIYHGEIYNHNWAVEAGVRLQFGAVLSFYCRYEKLIDINKFGGVNEQSPMIGFRLGWGYLSN
ncbi:MAG: hypothetical protein N2316_04515 [Spirochaetes bacterium]|nr:hypothetical protein [Spirochaetota bacterium]